MSLIATRSQKLIAKCAYILSSLLKRLNMDALAVIMFVTLGLLNSTRGKEPETRRPVSAEATTTRVSLDDFVNSPQELTLPPGCEGNIEPAR